jgi:ATP-dependent RNA helicase RhlE
MSFDSLGLSAELLRAVREQGYTESTPIQNKAIPVILQGLDIMACAQTGTGKTAGFTLPLLQRLAARQVDNPPRAIRALVLTPTRELAAQVGASIETYGRHLPFRSAVIFGGVKINPQIDKLRRGVDVLVATPGRLLDHAKQRTIDLSRVEILVLDEADRMLDFGFRPQVDRIVRRLPQNRQTMFFSATLDGEVGQLARAYTRSPSHFEASLPTGQQPAEIEHRFVPVTLDTKVETLAEHIRASDGLTLVFVRTKRGSDRLVQKLRRLDVDAVAMHGDMSQNARERALSRFRSNRVRALVATDVAARGLDLEGVTHVINFDPPEEDKGYVHRTGRTGRAGRSGTAITFVLPEQQADTSRVARRLGHGEQFEEAGMRSAPAKLLYTSRRGRRSKW